MDKLKLVMLLVLTLAIISSPLRLCFVYAQGPIAGGPYDQGPLTPTEIAYFNREDRLWRQAAIDLLKGHYAAAEAAAREEGGASEIQSSGAAPLLALALDGEGKDQEALQLYAQIYKGGEWHPGILLPYAELLLKHGQWAKALAVYNRALPEVGGGPDNGAQLLLEDSSFAEDDPEPADLETDIHIALAMAGDFVSGADGHYHPERNLVEAKKALALEPDSPLANLEYAEALKEAGRGAAAYAAFTSVASKYGGDIRKSAEAGEMYTRPMPGTSQ
jgi:hypothetical protein